MNLMLGRVMLSRAIVFLKNEELQKTIHIKVIDNSWPQFLSLQ